MNFIIMIRSDYIVCQNKILPRIFAAEKIGVDFSTDVVFLLLNRERIVRDPA